MTKIKLSFKEMRQKFLKKVISPHVSQILVTTKLQFSVKSEKIQLFIRIFIIISSQSSFSNLRSGHKKSDGPFTSQWVHASSNH